MTTPPNVEPSEGSALNRAKLMLEAKCVIKHYDEIIASAPLYPVANPHDDDFVITTEDYQTLRDYALLETDRLRNALAHEQQISKIASAAEAQQLERALLKTEKGAARDPE